MSTASRRAPGLGGPLALSVLLHVVVIAGFLFYKTGPARDVPPMYRVDLVAAPAGERAVGVVRETEAPTPRGDDALAFIMNDLARNEHLRESSELAAVVQQRLGVTHPSTNRGVKQAGLAVLATAYMPAILVELGFGSNTADARWMASDEGQEHAAQAIADAAFEYLQHYERRTRGGQR